MTVDANRVSEERLALIASGITDRLQAGASGAPNLDRDIASAIEELLSLRRSPSLSGGEVVGYVSEQTLNILARGGSGVVGPIYGAPVSVHNQPLYASPAPLEGVTPDAVLDAASEYLKAQYGLGALSHPVDRARILSAIVGSAK